MKKSRSIVVGRIRSGSRLSAMDSLSCWGLYGPDAHTECLAQSSLAAHLASPTWSPLAWPKRFMIGPQWQLSIQLGSMWCPYITFRVGVFGHMRTERHAWCHLLETNTGDFTGFLHNTDLLGEQVYSLYKPKRETLKIYLISKSEIRYTASLLLQCLTLASKYSPDSG